MAAKEEKTKAPAVPRELPKFNVNHLSEDLGKSPSEVRVLLRKSGLEKSSGAWGWEKKSEYDAALKTLKALTASKPASGSKGDTEAEGAPAKKTSSKGKKAA